MHTHSLREARLIGLNGAPNAPQGLTPENAPQVLPTVQQRLQVLQGQVNAEAGSTLGEELRANILRKAHTELEQLKQQIALPTEVKLSQEQETQRVQMKERIDALQQSVSARITQLTKLTQNSMYQLFRKSGLGGVSGFFGGIFKNVMPIVQDIKDLVMPTVQSILKPIQAMGPTAMSMAAGAVRWFSPTLGDSLQRYADGDRPATEMRLAFEDAIATSTFKGTPLEERSPANTPAERGLLSILKRASGMGDDAVSFAAKVMEKVQAAPGGAITYAQLLTAARQLSAATAPAPAPTPAVPERQPSMRPITLENYNDQAPMDVMHNDIIRITLNVAAAREATVNGDTVVFQPSVLVPARSAPWLALQYTQPIVGDATAPNGTVELRITQPPAGATATVNIGGKTVRLERKV